MIALSPLIVVPRGIQHGFRAAIFAFTSGTPLPSRDDVTFYFNGSPTLPEGSAVIEFDLIFPRNIMPNIAGTYTIEVATASGIARDTVQVIVTSKFNVSASFMRVQLNIYLP